MQIFFTAAAPTPGGHYSQAIIHNGLIYLSGQLPIHAQTNKICEGTIEEQCTLVLKNIQAILQAAGSSLEQVIRCTVYLADISLWDQVNAVYGEFFGAHRPARSIVPVGVLHHGALVEMDCIAVIPSAKDV